MADEKKAPFPGGFRVFPRMDKQPDFVKASIAITLNDFIKFCKDNPDMLFEYGDKKEKQLKIQLLLSKEGKLYAAVDTYGTPAGKQAAAAQPQTSQSEDWGAGAKTTGAAQPAAADAQAAADNLPF